MPWRSAQAPNSASAPAAPPLNRMPSSRFIVCLPRRCDHTSAMEPRRYRAGETVEDFCRVCKTDRMHTVVAADADGRPIRVDCGYCHSEHNYRGGARIGLPAGPPPRGATPAERESPARAPRETTPPRGASPRPRSDRPPFPIVSERERTGPPMSPDREADLELLLRRIIREETGITPVVPAEKWRGGTLVL